jgi:hypothetical protein
MKTLLTLFPLLFIFGCNARHRGDVISIQMDPIEIEVKTILVKDENDSSPNRYWMEFSVLGPEKHQGKKISLVVDRVPKDSDFLRVGDEWIIDFDTDGFRLQEDPGFAFWDFHELSPKQLSSNK